jgi:hypothetical protein
MTGRSKTFDARGELFSLWEALFAARAKRRWIQFTYPIARPAKPTPAHSASETKAASLCRAGDI